MNSMGKEKSRRKRSGKHKPGQAAIAAGDAATACPKVTIEKRSSKRQAYTFIEH
jgi:hypothetical protein